MPAILAQSSLKNPVSECICPQYGLHPHWQFQVQDASVRHILIGNPFQDASVRYVGCILTGYPSFRMHLPTIWAPSSLAIRVSGCICPPYGLITHWNRSFIMHLSAIWAPYSLANPVAECICPPYGRHLHCKPSVMMHLPIILAPSSLAMQDSGCISPPYGLQYNIQNL